MNLDFDGIKKIVLILIPEPEHVFSKGCSVQSGQQGPTTSILSSFKAINIVR